MLVAVLLGMFLSSCGARDAEPATGSPQALPPVIAEVAELDGSTFEITPAQPLVVNAPDPTKWTGEASDDSVAEFVPGEDDGSALFNPGFKAKGSGSTDATMTAPDGTVYAFTIVVR